MSIITLVFDDYLEKSGTEFHEAVAANDLQKVKDLIQYAFYYKLELIWN